MSAKKSSPSIHGCAVDRPVAERVSWDNKKKGNGVCAQKASTSRPFFVVLGKIKRPDLEAFYQPVFHARYRHYTAWGMKKLLDMWMGETLMPDLIGSKSQAVLA